MRSPTILVGHRGSALPSQALAVPFLPFLGPAAKNHTRRNLKARAMEGGGGSRWRSDQRTGTGAGHYLDAPPTSIKWPAREVAFLIERDLLRHCPWEHGEPAQRKKLESCAQNSHNGDVRRQNVSSAGYPIPTSLASVVGFFKPIFLSGANAGVWLCCACGRHSPGMSSANGFLPLHPPT
jgi:hypothetical protein